MTALLLLLASAPGPVTAESAVEVTEEQAISKASAKAKAFGIKTYGAPSALLVERDHDKIWRVNLSPVLNRPTAQMELAASDGHLIGFSDPQSFDAPPLKGWTPRIARVSARSRAVAFARKLGVPASWAVGRTSFDGTGKNRWPMKAELSFEERPMGYRYLVDGNTARVTFNPRTGALTGYALVDTFSYERTAIRFRPDQAGTIARKWRTTERSDPRPKVLGPIRLGWALLGDTQVARLVYDVPFAIETHWVDVNSGRVVGGRRTKTVVY